MRAAHTANARPQNVLHCSRIRPRIASRCVAPTGTAPPTATKEQLFTELGSACTAWTKAPPSLKLEYSADVLASYNDLKAAGALPKWGAATADGAMQRQNVFLGQLKQMGIKAPDQLAVPSTRNDLAFLVSVVGVSSVLAVVLGQLPGDWGFFGAYFSGGISIVVLAIGSTAPGLLQVVIDKFSQVFPDYRERVVRHEAAHLLVGYLCGVPVTSYGLGIGQEHVAFAEAKLQRRIFQAPLTDADVDALAVVAVAGIAAEGLAYEQVIGQTADLFDLQRILARSQTKMGDAQQQNITRWAVWTAATLLRKYKAEFTAVQEALAAGKSVPECVRAIEGTPTAA